MCKLELTEFFAELTEFAPKLSEFSSPKQYSRNSILPVSHPDLDLSLLFCPFLGLSRFFRDFPNLSWDSPGSSRLVLFLFHSLLTAPRRNSPERVRDRIWTVPAKSGKPPGLASLKIWVLAWCSCHFQMSRAAISELQTHLNLHGPV